MEEKKTMQLNTIVSLSSQEIVTVIVMLILLLIILILIISCKLKPWRRNRSRLLIKADYDIERPLVSEDLSTVEDIIDESAISDSIGGDSHQTQRVFTSPRSITVAHTKNLSTSPQLVQSDSFILDIADDLENSSFSQTLKRNVSASPLAEDQQIHEEREDISYSSNNGADKDTPRTYVPSITENQRCILMLEVIAGPSRGLSYSIQSTEVSKLPVNIGRVSPADILLKDSEVSGKHAMINWNVNKLKWELVDMGSLNGTLLNSQIVHHHQSGSRHWGNPIDLSSGDVITLGTSSKIHVHITAEAEHEIPFGIGTASDPMSMRRGAKKLPMEDVCYYQWPLTGTNEFGVFGICDGHGGADAATSASKIMPEVIAGILSDPIRRKKVLMKCDASDVLREAFIQTEARINHYYEGCTATVLLLWADAHENFYAQCANVGDSACIVNTEEKQVKMSEDHRIVSHTEKARFQALGAPLRDGETRICGINLARMIGDKFLKEQDTRFSSEPYLSEVVHIRSRSSSFALLASDGFWDVVSTKKSFQLVHQMMEGSKRDSEDDSSADKIANLLLNEARTLRTKDNTSIIFIDFSTTNRNYSCRLDP